jgi:methionyl-tRNA synthetase
MSDQAKPQITFEQFAALDIRVARIIEAQDHPNADKLIVLKVDLGSLGQRQIVAGIRQHYKSEELLGKQIAVVANLAPRMMRNIESQGMLLAAVEGNPPVNVVLMTPDRQVAPGTPIS